MKKPTLVVAIVLFTIGLLYCFACLSAHKKAMDQHTPLSTEELVALSEIFNPGWATSPTGIAEAKLPQALSISPTTDSILAKYGGEPSSEELVEDTFAKLYHLSLKIHHGSQQFSGLGLGGGSTPLYHIGSGNMSLRNFDVAKLYMEASIRNHISTSPAQCKNILVHLAEVEPDPERAALMLRLACQGKSFNVFISLCKSYQLCIETGSTQLADHYLDRIYTEYPNELKNMAHGFGFNIPPNPSAK